MKHQIAQVGFWVDDHSWNVVYSCLFQQVYAQSGLASSGDANAHSMSDGV